MEQVLDYLALFLDQFVGPSPGPGDVTWVLGDIGQGEPQALPIGYIAPLNDSPKGYSAGVDMDTYQVPMLVVFAKHIVAQPVQSQNTQTFEQPGYRNLLQLAQNIRGALRTPMGITLGGLVATSSVVEIRYVLTQIDSKTYRAARITVEIKQRRAR